MTWFNNSFRRTERALLLALAVALGVAPLHAQNDSLETRYQKGVAAFNSAKMEDACDLLTQVEKESPNYKSTRTYLNPACSSAKKIYAQEETLYNDAQELIKNKNYDDAKQKLNQASRLSLNHPKYRTQIEASLKQIAQAESGAHADAEFQNAVQAFNAGKDEEATRLFTQIEQGKGPKADDARAYLRRITDRQEDASWSKAVDAFNRGDYPTAGPLFSEISSKSGKHAAEAQSYLSKIKGAQAQDAAFDEAVKLFDKKRYPEAQAKFQDVVRKKSPRSADAQAYLQRIANVQKEENSAQQQAKERVAQTGENPKQVADKFVAEARTAITSAQYVSAVEKLRAAEVLDPSNSDIHALLAQAQQLASEQPLRLGLKAYFLGKYEEAEQQLSTYIDSTGPKLQLAYFFRGASHASRYLLSDSADAHEKDLAVADFKLVQEKSAQPFQPPAKYVGAKVLALYSQSASPRR